jgi:putative glycosyltransferase (TIGR04372 family)
MDHLLVRVGRRRVLVADVCASNDGHGVGYGILLKRIDKVLWCARVMDVAVFYIREARSLNTAVFRLRSKDVEILPRLGWQAVWLRCVWIVTAPFRYGSPWLWTQHLCARALLGSFYEAVERSRHMPRALRRFIMQPRPLYRTLRRANRAYAELSASAWKLKFKPVERRLRKAEQKGRAVSRRLALPANREREAIAEASALGIRPTDHLVTVHVRESGYRSAAGLSQRQSDLLRNARVDTYFEAFSALVARGYTVVRLGDPTMSRIDCPGVIDFAALSRKSDWLEAWCVLHSEFLIGCDSGPSWLAVLLGVPVLTVNVVHFRDITRPADRVICKLARERATGRTLAISDMLMESYLRTGLDTNKYEHLDNEPSDISEAALDMIDVVHGQADFSPAQRRFNDRLRVLGRECTRDWSGLEGIACLRRPRGTLSRGFAEKYL